MNDISGKQPRTTTTTTTFFFFAKKKIKTEKLLANTWEEVYLEAVCLRPRFKIKLFYSFISGILPTFYKQRVTQAYDGYFQFE